MKGNHLKELDPAREMALRKGTVLQAAGEGEGLLRLEVRVEGKTSTALAYPIFSGDIQPGDEVLVNTTAVDLELGTGGVHFVLANLSRPGETDVRKPGHVMKLRYTPLQFKSCSLEEHCRDGLTEGRDLGGMVVLALELHSMLLPAVFALKRKCPGARLVYIMSDGGSLPLAFSRQAAYLRRQGYLAATITAGHAFGGDLEAVNMYTALQGARHLLKADACIAAMGPGVLGTGTAFGFSGIEQGENINRVNILGGQAVTCLRLSFTDGRERHRGVSHHSLTSLKRAALTPATVAMPAELTGEKRRHVLGQLEGAGLPGIHRLQWHPVEALLREMAGLDWKVTSMGRSLADDPLFFAAAAAAGVEGAGRLPGKEKEDEDGASGKNTEIRCGVQGEDS